VTLQSAPKPARAEPIQAAPDAARPHRPVRYPCFDGLRAIAALTVVAVHTSYASGVTTIHPGIGHYTARLEIGVEVFFVISGFLLYRPFVAAHMEQKAPPEKWAFWRRRLKRIIPAYWVAFLIVTYVMHDDTVRHAWYSPLVYLGFAQIYLPHYAVSGLTQAWSLCTEMTFYLFLPLYAAAVGRRRRDPDRQLRAELYGLGTLVLIGFVWRIPVLAIGTGEARTMPNWLPGYIDQFALGMLLAVVSTWMATTRRQSAVLAHRATPWVCWALAAAAFWAVSNIGITLEPLKASSVGISLERQALYGMFGFFMVVPAVFGPQDHGVIRRFLRSRPMQLIGIVSYGLYLWHEGWLNRFITMFHFHDFAIPWGWFTLFVVSMGLISATLSYRLVERPILQGTWKGWLRHS
jgi:peptidoglycan/LPS O-acetylase OafA/YrhL